VANTEDDKDSREMQDRKDPETETETATETAGPRRAGDDFWADEAGLADEESPRDEAWPAPTAAPAPRRGAGFFAPLLGGVVAACIGFATAQYIKPEGWSFPGAATGDKTQVALDATRAALDDVQSKIDTLAGANKAAEALAPRIDDVGAKVAALSDQLSALSDKVASFDQRLTEVLKAPVEAAGGATAKALSAYENEISEMRKENAQLSKSVNNMAKQAEADVGAAMDRAAEVEARAAMMRIDAALASGAPFDSAIGQFGDVAVPEALKSVAAKGVETLPELQNDFPEAARAALEEARKGAAQGDVTNRVDAFLRTQLGIRSLAPREGDDPDAILSRAEAALHSGDLSDALSELDKLPDRPRQAMSAWIDAATARADALDAAQTLEQSLNSN